MLPILLTVAHVRRIIKKTAGVSTDYVFWGGCENGAKTWCCIIDDASSEISRIEIEGTSQPDYMAGIYTGGYTFRALANSFPLQLEGMDGNDDILASTSTTARTIGLGGDGSDFISISGGSGTLYAEGGNNQDYIIGGDGSDELYGQGGDDYIVGQGGDLDTIDGGNGDDSICGDQTDFEPDYTDSVGSWSSSWQCYDLGTPAGPDLIAGGAGADLVYAGLYDDTVTGGDGQDILYGEGGEDKLAGEGDPDSVFGGDAHDEICGQGDYVRGGEGNDEIYMWPVSGGSYVGDYEGEGHDNTNPGDAYHPFNGFGNNTCETALSPAQCPF